jgi:WD40 repeat protein
VTNPYIDLPALKLRLLVELLTDLKKLDELHLHFSKVEFLEAAAFKLGTDDFLSRCSEINAITPSDHKLYETIGQVQQVFNLESHNFRRIGSTSDASLILQQIHNRSKELSFAGIAEDCANCLRKRNLPFLSLNWSTRIKRTPLLRTIVPGRSVYSISVTSDGTFVVGGGRISHSPIQVWKRDTGQLEWSGISVGKVLTIPDKTQAIAVTDDERLILWDLLEGIPIWSVSTNNEGTTDILLMPVCQKIVSASRDGSIKIWSLSDGQLLYSIEEQTYIHRLVSIPGTPWFGSVSGQDTLCAWNCETGQQELTLLGHSGGLIDFATTEDGKRAATISYDNTVAVWNLETGAQDAVFSWTYSDDFDNDFEGLSLSTVKVALSHEFVIFTADVFGAIEVWDYREKLKLYTLLNQDDLVHNIEISSSGCLLVTCGNHIKVIELATGELKSEVSDHASSIEDIVMTRDERWLISCDHDDIKIWDFRQLNLARTSSKHRSAIQKMKNIPNKDARRFLSASGDEIKIWDFEAGSEEMSFTIPRNHVHDLLVSPDGDQVFLATERGVKVWNLSKRQEVGGFQDQVVRSVSVAQTDYLAAAITKDETRVQVYDLISRQQLCEFINDGGPLERVWISPNGSWIVAQSRDSFLEVFEISSGRKMKELRLFAHLVRKVMVAPKKGRIVSIHSLYPHDYLRTWDFSSENETPLLEVEGEFSPRRTALTTDQDAILSVSHSSDELVIRDILTGEVVSSFEMSDTFGATVTPLRNSQVIISGAAKSGEWVGDIDIWNTETGRKEKTLGSDPSIYDIQASVNTRMVISHSPNGFRIWNTETGESELISGDFSSDSLITPDWERVVDCRGRNIRIWNTKRRQEEIVLSEHTSYVKAMMVTADGQILVSVSDGEVIFWDMATLQVKRVLSTSSDIRVEIASLSIDDKYVAVLRYGRGIRVWSRMTGDLRYDFRAQDGYADVHGFAQDSQVVISRVDGSMCIRDLDADTEHDIFRKSYFALLPDAFPLFRKDISSYFDWSLLAEHFEKDLVAPRDPVLTLTSELAVCKCGNRTIGLWDLGQGCYLAKAILDSEAECALVFGDEKSIVLGDRSGHLYCMEFIEPKVGK